MVHKYVQQWKKQTNISGQIKVLKQPGTDPPGKAAGKLVSYANEYEHFLFVEHDQAQRKEYCIMTIIIFLHMISWIERTLKDLFFIVI